MTDKKPDPSKQHSRAGKQDEKVDEPPTDSVQPSVALIKDVGASKANGKFDTRAFMNQAYTPREGEVEVPALKDFFAEGIVGAPGPVPVLWKVRGLTSDEIARCNEAAERNRKVEAIVEALTASNKADVADGVKQLLGIGSDVHAEVAKRLEQCTYGSIDPEITLDVAVKMATVAPVEFYAITNKILELTGLGQVAGKSKPSGKEQTSR